MGCCFCDSPSHPDPLLFLLHVPNDGIKEVHTAETCCHFTAQRSSKCCNQHELCKNADIQLFCHFSLHLVVMEQGKEQGEALKVQF